MKNWWQKKQGQKKGQNKVQKEAQEKQNPNPALFLLFLMLSTLDHMFPTPVQMFYTLFQTVKQNIRTVLWNLLLVFVYYCPFLYWRAGDEFKTSRFPDVRTKYKGGKMTYLNVLEHHGFCNPKICRWTSLAKTYGLANAYGVATQNSGRTTPAPICLVFVFGLSYRTWDIVNNLEEWHRTWTNLPDDYPLTKYKYEEAIKHVLFYSKDSMPGGVYITNSRLFALLYFEAKVVEKDDKTEAWWTTTDWKTAVFNLGYN